MGPVATVRILDSVLRKMEAVDGCKQGTWKGDVEQSVRAESGEEAPAVGQEVRRSRAPARTWCGDGGGHWGLEVSGR